MRAGSKLPGTRLMAETLNIHRKTVVAAYDELKSQGWTDSIPAKGTFVCSALPVIEKQPFTNNQLLNSEKNVSGFSFTRKKHLEFTELKRERGSIYLGDGLPDSRLSPIKEIAVEYRNVLKLNYNQDLGYDSIYGNLYLREALLSYLNETRGLSINIDQILITRGSQMGIYLASRLIVSDAKELIIGETNYKAAIDAFNETGAKIYTVEIDKNGIITDQIESLCKKKNVSAVYVTSHHHHPTTVSLSPERRMHLLALAKTYQFAIIEDDYAYDFHYSNAPILPLASNDVHGNVIYIGSFSKTIAPAIRIGYLIAPKDFVKEAAQLRRIIDRQGDVLLERTIASMIKEDLLKRHSKKLIKIYKTRRDLFCKLLKENLGNYLNFDIPDGGMAVWVLLDKKYNWDLIKKMAERSGLIINDWRRYDPFFKGHNGLRMGFSSLNEEEIRKSVSILKNVFQKLN
jgi:GntR family transcriptional regulator / MocR family aminotransferase